MKKTRCVVELCPDPPSKRYKGYWYCVGHWVRVMEERSRRRKEEKTAKLALVRALESD